MDYLKNHCWCSDSNWGGNYDCQIIVGLSSYKEGYQEDWENLIVTKTHYSQSEYKVWSETFKNSKYIDEEDLVEMSTTEINTLKPEVLKWLEDTIDDYQGVKGWCIGSEEYTHNDSSISYSVFFQRRSDAMKFIKTWSKWKKPINYWQYFTDVRKKLDLNTGEYVEY